MERIPCIKHQQHLYVTINQNQKLHTKNATVAPAGSFNKQTTPAASKSKTQNKTEATVTQKHCSQTSLLKTENAANQMKQNNAYNSRTKHR